MPALMYSTVNACIAGSPVTAAAPGGKALASTVNIESIVAMSPVTCAVVKRSFCCAMRRRVASRSKDVGTPRVAAGVGPLHATAMRTAGMDQRRRVSRVIETVLRVDLPIQLGHEARCADHHQHAPRHP